MASIRVNVWPAVGLGGSTLTANRSGTRSRATDGVASGATRGEGEATLTTPTDGDAAGATAGDTPGGGCAERHAASTTRHAEVATAERTRV